MNTDSTPWTSFIVFFIGEGEKYSPDSREEIPYLGKCFGEALIYLGLKSQWLLSTVDGCVAEAVFTFEPKDKDVYASGMKLD